MILVIVNYMSDTHSQVRHRRGKRAVRPNNLVVKAAVVKAVNNTKIINIRRRSHQIKMVPVFFQLSIVTLNFFLNAHQTLSGTEPTIRGLYSQTMSLTTSGIIIIHVFNVNEISM